LHILATRQRYFPTFDGLILNPVDMQELANRSDALVIAAVASISNT
jgi:hypothetical protein